MVIRRHYLISGDVQGVGFRYRAKYAASSLGITGYVMNRYDGKVEMELQGDRDSISRMLAQIDAGTFIHMEDINWWKKGGAFLKAKFKGRKYSGSF